MIYGCNLTVDSTNAVVGNNGPFRIYRWANEAADPTVAYIGEADAILAHRRFGDSMVVCGAGVSTEILVGSRSGKTVTRFTTADGINFAHQKIAAPGLIGVANTMTIAFGVSNTFWIKTEASPTTNYPLQQFSFDTGTATATLLNAYTMVLLCADHLLLTRAEIFWQRCAPFHTSFYKLTDGGFVQQHSAHIFGVNGNGNNTGTVIISGDKVFALESNNGIRAFTLSSHTLATFEILLSVSGGQATLSWPSSVGFSCQVQQKGALEELVWANLGNATNGTGNTISISEPADASGKFYRISAQ